MRRYLLDKDELPKTTLTAMAPISVRSGEEKGDMGNQVAAMIAPLGTHIATGAERLRYVHSQTDNSKAVTDAIGARNMTEISKVSPALFMALGADRKSVVAGKRVSVRVAPVGRRIIKTKNIYKNTQPT